MIRYSDALQRSLARLDALTNWEQRARGEMHVGLEPIRDLASRLGNPHLDFRAVHVTGTKGKGSVCALVEAALCKAGISVGRYASPHLQRVNERISLSQKPISDRKLSELLASTLDVYEQAKLDESPARDATWFDIFTACAFLAFKESAVTWAIVEVGLGGTNDSTNIINGDIAVVTNVELEHTEVLGTTRSAIAKEKSGILKAGAQLVTTLSPEDEAGEVLRHRASSLGCSVEWVNPFPTERIEELNTRVAGTVLDCLGASKRQKFGMSEASHSGLAGAWLLDDAVRASARLPGRLERFNVCNADGKTLTVVMDGAHVPFNLEAVLAELSDDVDLSGPCVAVLGTNSDKDATGLITVLARHVVSIVLTELPGLSRSMRCAQLKEITDSMNLTSETASTVALAVDRAIQLASKRSGWVLITGSLQLAGASRSLELFSNPY